jgi:hypothetical protein
MPDSPAVSPRITAYPNLHTSGSGPPSWDENFPPELTEERKQTLLAYWRGVFSGEAEPEVLPIPPQVEEAVRREFPGEHSGAFWRGARIEYAMRWFYGGQWVVYLDSPRGCVILAGNRAEALFLVESFPWKQVEKTATTYPPPWEEVIE